MLQDKIQKPRYVLGEHFPRNQCYGSKKWRWLIQWTIKNLRALFKETLISRIPICSTRGLGLLWIRSYRVPTSKRRSVWTNRKLKKKIGFFAEDRSLPWSTITSKSLALMTPFFITLTYSQLLFATMIFKNSFRDGRKFYCRCNNSHQMISWKACTNWEYAWSSGKKNTSH